MLSLVHVGHNYWHPIIATSFSQGNSSEFSPIMPEEFGEHLIRDRRPFSSYRISPDPSDSQLHVSTSLQFTPLIFCRVQVRGLGQPWQKLHFVLSDQFLCLFWCLFWIVVLVEDPNMAYYKISNRGSQVLILYLLVFDRIHDAMHLNKMFRTSGKKAAYSIKDPAVYLTVDMGYFFIPVCTKLIWWVCCQKAIFSVSSDHRSQCHLKFQSCLTTEFAGVCFWMSEENFP